MAGIAASSTSGRETTFGHKCEVGPHDSIRSPIGRVDDLLIFLLEVLTHKFDDTLDCTRAVTINLEHFLSTMVIF